MHYVADNETEGDIPGRWPAGGRRRRLGIKRRTEAEKAASVVAFPAGFLFPLTSFQRRVRAHMETLIPRDYWLQDLLHPGELEAWDSKAGPCCTPAPFKLNFNGTPHDD